MKYPIVRPILNLNTHCLKAVYNMATTIATIHIVHDIAQCKLTEYIGDYNKPNV